MGDQTVWRLTEEDFKAVIEEKYPELTNDQIEEIINAAYSEFSIHDWETYIEAFVDVVIKNNIKNNC